MNIWIVNGPPLSGKGSEENLYSSSEEDSDDYYSGKSSESEADDHDKDQLWVPKQKRTFNPRVYITTDRQIINYPCPHFLFQFCTLS